MKRSLRSCSLVRWFLPVFTRVISGPILSGAREPVGLLDSTLESRTVNQGPIALVVPMPNLKGAVHPVLSE